MTSLVTNGGRLEKIEAHIPLPPLLSAMTTFQNPNNYGWLQPSPLPTFFPPKSFTLGCASKYGRKDLPLLLFLDFNWIFNWI